MERAVLVAEIAVSPAIPFEQQLAVLFSLDNLRVAIVVCQSCSNEKVMLSGAEHVSVAEVVILKRLNDADVVTPN